GSRPRKAASRSFARFLSQWRSGRGGKGWGSDIRHLPSGERPKSAFDGQEEGDVEAHPEWAEPFTRTVGRSFRPWMMVPGRVFGVQRKAARGPWEALP